MFAAVEMDPVKPPPVAVFLSDMLGTAELQDGSELNNMRLGPVSGSHCKTLMDLYC